MRFFARSLALLFPALLAVGCGSVARKAGIGATPTPTGLPAAPFAAYCTIPVQGKGTLDMETDYLPHVVQCENGGAGIQSLTAQAIAARSYAYYKLEVTGSVTDGQGDQVYSCGGTPTQAQIDAVKATAGQVLVYHNDVICSFFVAGAKPSNHTSCVAVSGDSDATNTEHYVTYNDGKSGTDVTQSTLGLVNPTNYRNRGCLSQWGSRCLENAGASYTDMVHFYYGADIVLALAAGPCSTGVSTMPPPLGFRPADPTDWQPAMRIGPNE